jgi:hypothetical protein
VRIVKKQFFGLMMGSIAATLIMQIFNNYWWALPIACAAYLIILFAVLCNTRIGFWNFLIFQWLFIRLCYFSDSWGNVVSRGFIFPICPLTGWTFIKWSIDFYPNKVWKVVLYATRGKITD